MPSLLTHHLIARAVAEGLKGSVFEAPLDRYPEYLYLGAVFHDALFYVSAREEGARFKPQAARLHGQDGEDTLFLPRRLLQEAVRGGAAGPEPDLVRAFTAGLISHIQADAVFHPFVFFFSGPAQDPLGKRSHRRLETLLDLFFSRRRGRPDPLKGYLKRTGKGAVRVLSLTGRLLVGEEEAPAFSRTMVRALDRMGLAQILFQNRVLARLLFSLEPLLPRPARDAAALAQAPQLDRFLPRLEGRLEYLHPVTGQREETTLEELFQRAAAGAAALARRLTGSLEEGRENPGGPVGPCLSTGLPGVGEEKMTYFSSERLVG